MNLDEHFRAIQQNIEVAAQAYREGTGSEPLFDRAMVEWIERNCRSFASKTGAFAAEDRAHLYSVLGSAFAECLRRASGGEWTFVDGEWVGIYVEKSDLTINPWKKIAGALDGEIGESPLGMLTWVESKTSGKA